MKIIRILPALALCAVAACDNDERKLENEIEAAEEYQEHHYEARQAADRGDLREAAIHEAEAVGERNAALRGADPLGEEIQGQIAEERADDQLDDIEDDKPSR